MPNPHQEWLHTNKLD